MTTNDEPTTPDDEAVLAATVAENERLRAELDAAKGEKAKRRAAGRRRTRKIIVGFLVVLTAVAVLASTISVWVKATVFQTDRFVALIEPALSDPAVTNAIANKVSDQLFMAFDLQGQVTSLLPSQLAPFVGPLTSAVRNYVRGKVQEVFASSQFHALLVQVISVAHTKAVALLRGDYSQLPNLVVQNGLVQLNLLPIIGQVLRQIAVDGASLFGISLTIPDIPPGEGVSEAVQKLSTALGRPLPADFGQITLFTTAQLKPLQDAVKKFDRFVILAVLLTIVLFALALVLSVNRRRTLIQLGIGVVAALLVAAVAIRRISDAVVEKIANPNQRVVASDLMSTVIHSLRTVIVWVAVIAAILAIVAYLAGRPAWFTRSIAWVRRQGAGGQPGDASGGWVAGHADLLRIAAIVVAVLLLLVIGVGVWSFLIIGGLAALFIWWVDSVRRRAIPLEPTDDATGVSDGAEALSGTNAGAGADQPPGA